MGSWRFWTWVSLFLLLLLSPSLILSAPSSCDCVPASECSSLSLVPSARHGNSCKDDGDVRCCLEAVTRTAREAVGDECTCQPPGLCPAAGRRSNAAFDCGSFELCCLPAVARARPEPTPPSLSLHDAVQIFEPSPQFMNDVSIEGARTQEAPPKTIEPEKTRDITIIPINMRSPVATSKQPRFSPLEDPVNSPVNAREPAPASSQPRFQPFEAPVNTSPAEPRTAAPAVGNDNAPRRFFHRFFGPKPHIVPEDKPLKFQLESEPRQEQVEVPSEVTAALESAGIRSKPPGVHIDENKTLVIDGGAPVVLLNEEDRDKSRDSDASFGRVQFPTPYTDEVRYQERIPQRVENFGQASFSPRFRTTTTATTTTTWPTTSSTTPAPFTSTSDFQTDEELFDRVLGSLWHVARLLVYDRTASVIVVGENNESSNFTITMEEARTLAKLIAKISPSEH